MYMCDKLDRHVKLHDTTAVILEKNVPIIIRQF